MDLKQLFSDKTLKPKEKTERLTHWLLASKDNVPILISFANVAKDPVKATCIEAIEFATKSDPAAATGACFDLALSSLSAKAPRVKWESAKVIGNIAGVFPGRVAEAIVPLLDNAEHEGTVVRWSAAYALGEILKLKTKVNADLIPAIQVICGREEKNSIKKIYLAALKKTGV